MRSYPAAIDSSAVVAAMADQTSEPVKTFSIGFPDADFDELRFARMVAERFATDHHEFVVEPHALEIMPKLARHYGEPFADPSAIPSFYLAELTSRPRHRRPQRRRWRRELRRVPSLHRQRHGCALRLAAATRCGGWRRASCAPLGDGPRSNERPREGPAAWRGAGDGATRCATRIGCRRSRATCASDMLQPDSCAVDGRRARGCDRRRLARPRQRQSQVDRMLDTDVNTYLPGDLLVKMDIATMAYSVEGRSPLLDHRLMEFAAALPPKLKLHGMNGKVLLKSALRGVVPDEILDRPKMGFGVPLPRWFREELRDLPGEMLMGSDARVHAYVKPEAIGQMIDEHHDSVRRSLAALWVAAPAGAVAPRGGRVAAARRSRRHGRGAPPARRWRMSDNDERRAGAGHAPRDDAFRFGRNWQRYISGYLDPGRERIAARVAARQLVGDLARQERSSTSGAAAGCSRCAPMREGARERRQPRRRSRRRRVNPRAARPRGLAGRAGACSTARSSTRRWSPSSRPADVVYSWGVLHHTGDMDTAIRNAAALVQARRCCSRSRSTTGSLARWLSSQRWWRIKRAYNHAPRATQVAMELIYASYWLLGQSEGSAEPNSRGSGIPSAPAGWPCGPICGLARWLPVRVRHRGRDRRVLRASCGLRMDKLIPVPSNGSGNNRVRVRAPG